jgi:hypothetical protein
LRGKQQHNSSTGDFDPAAQEIFFVAHDGSTTSRFVLCCGLSEAVMDVQMNGTAAIGPDDELLSPERVAKMLDVSMRYLRKLIADGLLDVIYIGHKTKRIRRSSYDGFLLSRTMPREVSAPRKAAMDRARQKLLENRKLKREKAATRIISTLPQAEREPPPAEVPEDDLVL